MKIFVFLLLIFLNKSFSVVLECEYKNNAGNYVGYTCDAKNVELITSRDDQEITEVQGQHLSEKTDDDVVGFYAGSRKVDFFPRGLTKFFKNIKNIQIHYTNLQEIVIDDLKEFNNQLETLWLYDNKITHIETFAFDGLEKLITLYLFNNPCTTFDNQAYKDRSKVLEVIIDVETTCKDPNYIPRITTTTTTENSIIAALKKEILNLTTNLTLTIENLTAKNDEIHNLKLEKSKITKLKDEVLNIQETNTKFTADILELQNENQNLMEKNKFEKEIMLKFSSLETKMDQQKIEILTSISQKCDLIPKYAKYLELDEKIEKIADEI